MNYLPVFSDRVKRPSLYVQKIISHPISLLIILVLTSLVSNAQHDSLVLNNGDIIVGEVKQMTKQVLIIETDYSDSDFKVEWDKVSELYSDQLYTVALENRVLLAPATIKTSSPGVLRVEDNRNIKEIKVNDIVYFRQLDESFWSKMSASVDFGYSLTKAQNLQQYNASATLGFKTPQWTINANYRQVRSSQDDVDPVRRVEGALRADYLLRNGIFFGAGLNFLSNSEQNLSLRTTGVLGGGYYFVQHSSWYWNAFTGVAINDENFEASVDVNGVSADRESYEGVVGTEINLYNTGDLNLFTNVYWYPSFTEQGRHRVDYKFDISYDLPLDFYVKAGLTLNYDNQPAPGASDTDYVVVTGFGWEL